MGLFTPMLGVSGGGGVIRSSEGGLDRGGGGRRGRRTALVIGVSGKIAKALFEKIGIIAQSVKIEVRI